MQKHFVLLLALTCLTLPASAATTYRNPVISSYTADPSIIKVGTTYYAYVTSNACYSSSDMVTWVGRGGFFSDSDWAPDMYHHTDLAQPRHSRST